MRWATTRLPAGAGRPSGGVPVDLLVWIGVLIVVVLAAGVAITWVRRRTVANPSRDDGAIGSMHELRAMVERGELSREEYEQVRRTVVAKLRENENSDS